MIDRLKLRLRSLPEVYGADPVTFRARAAAWLHFQLSDHAFLRGLWANFAEVAPGVFRANQPSPRRLRDWHARGFRSVLNLRGASTHAFHVFERREAAALGLTLADLKMSAKVLPSRETLLDLHTLFTTLPRPMVMHCKSGADRTGLAAALYLLLIENRSIPEAQQQLSFRFLHRKDSASGVLDHLLSTYARDHAASGIAPLDWIRTAYDPVTITADWATGRAGRRR